MRAKPEPKVVRELVLNAFSELGVPRAGLDDMEERVLIQDGKATARTLRAGSLMAMWLIEVGIVQVYDADGNMLRTIDLLREVKPRRMAA